MSRYSYSNNVIDWIRYPSKRLKFGREEWSYISILIDDYSKREMSSKELDCQIATQEARVQDCLMRHKALISLRDKGKVKKL